MSGIFRKTSQDFQIKFLNCFQNRKTITLVFKLVRNHHLDQNLAKFSVKNPKSAIFPLKLLFFKIFGAFGAENGKAA